MIIFLLIGLVLFATAVALITRGVIAARLRTADNLGQIGHYGFAGTTEFAPTGGLRGYIDSAAAGIGRLLSEPAPRQRRAAAEDADLGRDVPHLAPDAHRLPAPLRDRAADGVARLRVGGRCLHRAGDPRRDLLRLHRLVRAGLHRAASGGVASLPDRPRNAGADRPARGHRRGGPQPQRRASARGRANAGSAGRRAADRAPGAADGALTGAGAREHGRRAARRPPWSPSPAR